MPETTSLNFGVDEQLLIDFDNNSLKEKTKTDLGAHKTIREKCPDTVDAIQKTCYTSRASDRREAEFDEKLVGPTRRCLKKPQD